VSYSVEVRHAFETAHRLPYLGGACASIHGHSWQARVMATAPSLNCDGTVVEFCAFKRALRSWIDVWLDNGAMLGVADSLLPAFTADGSKTFRFGAGDAATEAEILARDQPWPTAEAVALVIARAACRALEAIPHADGSLVTEVVVAETSANTAIWRMEGTA